MKKTCFKCNEQKDISEFYTHPKMVDGHLGKCKECTKKYVSSWHNENMDKVRAYSVSHRKNNPEKVRAKNMLNNAIRDGKIKRQPCRRCGNPKSQAHHTDYSKPFDVDWLCFRHHREAHGQTVTSNFGELPG